MRALRFAAVALALAAMPAVAQDIAAHIQEGDAARCRRNAEEALTHFRAALAVDSMNYEALWRASQALVDMGKQLTTNQQRARRDTLYAEGLELAQRAVRQNANGADGHFMVAVATGRVALTKGARDRVRYAGVVRDEALRAIELDPRHAGAMHVMGRWNAEIQRLPGMTKFFAKTFLGASVFNQASWANAVDYFNQALAIQPENIYHHLDLAEALVDADREQEAIPHLERVAQLELGCDPMDATYKEQAAALLERVRQH
jgi:tetratricopeptide (TPR) repeat protein